MQQLFLLDINLNGNQIKNVALEQLSSAPEVAVGRMYYDTTKKAIGYCNGTSWVYLGGGSSEHGSVSSITKTDDTFTVTYADGSSEELKLMYESAMDDELTTPVKVGGLPAGTKASDLKKKTLSQVFDDILFEEVQPTIQNPSASLAFKDGFANNSLYEIGAPAPADPTNFNKSFNRGTVTCPGKPNANRAGELDSESSFIYYGGSDSNKELPSEVTLGAMSYRYRAAYGQGDTLYTSKGNLASVKPNPLEAGTVDSGAIQIYGTYPYFSNGAQASTTANELGSLPSSFVDQTKFTTLVRIDNDSKIAAKFASEAQFATKAKLYVPATKKVTKVMAMNALSGAFDVEFNDWEMGSETVQIEVQGKQVDYKVWTTKSGTNGGNQYLFTIANA